MIHCGIDTRDGDTCRTLLPTVVTPCPNEGNHVHRSDCACAICYSEGEGAFATSLTHSMAR